MEILEDENDVEEESREKNSNQGIELKNFTKTYSFRRPQSIRELEDVDYHEFEISDEIANKIGNISSNIVKKENFEFCRGRGDIPNKKTKQINKNNK